jgi:2-polyprenyl-3-methyl-5-hydroxy-6-metoxy-1,4-benzoquinol methylase
MNRIGEEAYEQLTWAGGTTRNFTKPPYDRIEELKKTPMGKRLPEYSEFYELQTYLDALGSLKPAKMLDVGAGTGALSNLFTLLGWEVTACDYDASAMRFKGCTFVQHDLNKDIPFGAGHFDALVCKQTVEHLENPNHLIRSSAVSFVPAELQCSPHRTLRRSMVAGLSCGSVFLFSLRTTGRIIGRFRTTVN